jgi:hypothetical protein
VKVQLILDGCATMRNIARYIISNASSAEGARNALIFWLRVAAVVSTRVSKTAKASEAFTELEASANNLVSGAAADINQPE